MECMPIKSCRHISKKIENWNEIIMLLLFHCSWLTSFIHLYPFLCWVFFCTDITFWPHFTLQLVYLWVWWSMLRFMLRFIPTLVALMYCVCLYWRAKYWWHNSIQSLVLSPRLLRACMEYIVWSWKYGLLVLH